MQAGLIAPLAFALLSWSAAPVAIRIALTGYSPLSLAALRFLIASAALAALAWRARIGWPARQVLPHLFCLAAFGMVIHHIALNYGQARISAGLASLLAQTAPVFAAWIAHLTLGERLRWRGWAGIAVCMAGAAVSASAEARHAGAWQGVALILVASLSLGIYFTLQKAALTRATPLALSAHATWLAAGAMLALHAVLGAGAGAGLGAEFRAANLAADLAVVFLGVFPTAIGYLAWSAVQTRLSVAQTTICLYLMPPLSMLIAIPLLGEVPPPMMLVGGVLTLIGVALALRR